MFVFVVAWYRSAQSVFVPNKKKREDRSPWPCDLVETTSTPRLGNALALIEPRAKDRSEQNPHAILYARGKRGAQKQTPFVSGPGA